MLAYIEVLGSGTADAAAGILIFFDDARYMFECGDGTQRYCTEHSVRLSRLRGIYLTSLAAPSLGGLLGMVLTIADAGKEQVTIVGPKGLSSVFSSAKRAAFCYRPAMETRLFDIESGNAGSERKNLAQYPSPQIVCDDSNLRIEAVPVPVLLTEWDQARKLEPSQVNYHYGVQCYICKLKDIPGAFNPSRALELGVPRGPDFGRLSKGNSVTLSTGETIHSCDVTAPCTPGPVVLVVSCPGIQYIEGIVCNPALCPSALGICDDVDGHFVDRPLVCILYHLSPREVLTHAKYVKWFQSFGNCATHVALHSSMSPSRIVFAAQAQDHAHMRQFDTARFQEVRESAAVASRSTQDSSSGVCNCVAPEEFLSSHEVFAKGQWHVGDCGMQFMLAPTKNAGVCLDNIPPRAPPCVTVDPTGATMSVKHDLYDVDIESPNMREPACIAGITSTTAEVCFLGTAGAIPGRHRNVSGIFLNLFSRGNVLLDCGEGSWGQLTRAYGMEEARQLICDLKVVFISHKHADHHLGLLTILRAREESLRLFAKNNETPKLIVLGPSPLGTWLQEYHTILLGSDDCPLTHSFLDAQHMTDPQLPESKYFSDSFGLDIACVDVVHCPKAYGIVIKDRVCQWKIVYSGDTRPCRALAEAGADATLAIHEATLDDSLLEEAQLKNHSTVSEALQVCGEWMGAWRTILTHFSQRYPRIPLLDPTTMTKLNLNRAAVAFDLMRVNFADLASLPSISVKARQAFLQESAAVHVVE